MNSTLHTPCRLAAVAGLLLCISSAVASPVLPKSTGAFARFTAAYVDPREAGIDAGWGAFAAIGARFGDGEAAAEVGQIRLDQSETLDLGDVILEGTADLRVTSVMVGGRYGVRLGRTDRVRLLIGGMLGFSHLALSASATDGEDTLALKTDSTGAVWAGDVGLAVALSETIELSAGYRYMAIEGTTWEEYGYELEIPSQAANLYSVSLAYRW